MVQGLALALELVLGLALALELVLGLALVLEWVLGLVLGLALVLELVLGLALVMELVLVLVHASMTRKRATSAVAGTATTLVPTATADIHFGCPVPRAVVLSPERAPD